jgi:hypothetical protein
MPDLELSTEQEVTLAVNFLTAANRPAKIDGTPTWRADPPGKVRLLTVNKEDGSVDPMQIVVWPEDNGAGDVEVLCDADADLGSGVRDVAAAFSLSLTGPEAATASISPGTPVVKRALPDDAAAAATGT